MCIVYRDTDLDRDWYRSYASLNAKRKARTILHLKMKLRTDVVAYDRQQLINHFIGFQRSIPLILKFGLIESHDQDRKRD